MNSNLKFLICGLGSIGQRHFNTLRNLGSHSIYAYRTGKATLSLKQNPDKTFTDFNEALSSNPDAVLITNPSSMHIPLAIEAAKKQIPLFIEKPLSDNLEGVDELESIVRENKTPVLLGYQFLYNPAFLQIQKSLAEKAIGNPISTKAHWGTYMPGWHPWEDFREGYAAKKSLGGGAVLTLIHELNYLTELFGEAKKIKAMRSQIPVLSIDVEEAVDILIEHSSGVVSNTHLSFFQRPLQRTLDVIGTEGTLYWDYTQPKVKVVHHQNSKEIDLSQNHSKDPAALLDLSHKAQMEHFIRVLKRQESPRIPLSKGISDLKLALNILKEIES